MGFPGFSWVFLGFPGFSGHPLGVLPTEILSTPGPAEEKEQVQQELKEAVAQQEIARRQQRMPPAAEDWLWIQILNKGNLKKL